MPVWQSRRARLSVFDIGGSMDRKKVSGVKQHGRAKESANEPVFIVKRASRFGGLDYLHISLIVLIVILVAFAFELSTFKTTVQCNYGAHLNGTCITPEYNSTQALGAAEQIIASYSAINSSLALLPYYVLPNESNVSYMGNQNEWLVTMPYKDPFTGQKLIFSMTLYGQNLSLAHPFMQTLSPISHTQNKAIGEGAISLSGKVLCTTAPPYPVYMITDPYAPGAFSAIRDAINASEKYNSTINMTYKFIFEGNSVEKYSKYGINGTQLLGMYLACASAQPKFNDFMSNLSIVFNGNPLSEGILSSIVNGSDLNVSEFNTCMESVPSVMEHQAQLAVFYNITETPTFIVDCKYQAIPQTLDSAINYTLEHANATASTG